MSTSLELLSRHLAIPGAGMEERALRLILELGTELVGAEEGSLFVVDDQAQELVLTMTVGSATSEEALRGQRMPIGKGLTGLAVLTREVQMGSTTYSDIKQSKERDPDQTGLDPTAVVAAPLMAGENVVGAITGVSFLPDKRFTARDAERYARFASVAGVVIDQRRRLQLVSGNQGEEQELVEQRIINRLTRIIDRNPHSLEAIANLLEAVDAMMAVESLLP
ncbi:GAF domain-containing protein [bacterium CPR1]|nr:GAF domain-containing protein [bacterium CPR1]